MSLSKSWIDRGLAQTAWPRCAGRPIRIATDCTGLTTAELAAHEIMEAGGGESHNVFGCDVLPASRKVMAALSSPDYVLGNMLDRTFEADHFVAKDLRGAEVSISRGSSALDFYVAGVMCTPWSPKGCQLGFEDDNAETMTNFLKTIAVLRPRCAILENVTRLISPKYRLELQKRLSVLKGYSFLFRVCRTAEWGIPQVRERLYIIFLRTSELTPKARKQMEQSFDRVLDACRVEDRPDFLGYLRAHGWPVPWQPFGSMENDKDESCTCSHLRVCSIHECQCAACKKCGHAARLCKWRKHTAEFILSHKKHRRAYLASWRKVRRDPKVRGSPGYFQLAKATKLGVSEMIRSPRERVLLQTLSSTRNLLQTNVIVDISQSIHRKVIRSDGNVPTISTGSTKLLVTERGVFLDADHCLALQGMDPNAFAETGVTDEDLHYMAGNAMTLPVIGSVMLAAGHLLNWGSPGPDASAGGA